MPIQFNLETLKYLVPTGTDPNSIVVMEESNYRWMRVPKGLSPESLILGNGGESYYAAPTKAAFIPQIWLQMAPFEPQITLTELESLLVEANYFDGSDHCAIEELTSDELRLVTDCSPMVYHFFEVDLRSA